MDQPPMLLNLMQVLQPAAAVLVLLLAGLAVGWVALFWHRRRVRRPLASFGGLDALRPLLAILPADERRAILLRGWMTPAEFNLLRGRAERAAGGDAMVSDRPGRNDGSAFRRRLDPEGANHPRS